MNKLVTAYRVLTKKNNWISAMRAVSMVKTPITYCWFLLTGKGTPTIRVRTPTGDISIRMRNHESARGFFSIFAREDYPLTDREPYGVLDVGANIGMSALYFISRHPDNQIFCVEPDPANLPFLRENLAPFSDRSKILDKACTTGEVGELEFYVSRNGRHSSLTPSDRATTKTTVAATPFESVYDEAALFLTPDKTALKIDIEGLEKDVILSLPNNKLNELQTIFVEALGVGDALGENWKATVRAGYVEAIENTTRRRLVH